MKITLNFDDIKKVIEESYIGIKNITISGEKGKELEVTLDVDGDTFGKKKSQTTQHISSNSVKPTSGSFKTKDLLPEFDGKAKVDYETIMALKEAERIEMTDEQIAAETHIPLVKSIEEKNEEAKRKGLMTTGRTSDRVMKNL